LRLRTGEEGAEVVVSWLETTFSNVIRVSDLCPLATQDASQALDTLYDDYVEKGKSLGRSA
jgi:hypothetical protein